MITSKEEVAWKSKQHQGGEGKIDSFILWHFHVFGYLSPQ